ncbi:hypothetical protein KV557_29820 [Kitasatospora aureofaciens]|uniref:hypothetical protein n=1 Tax=Kitasatospora aureofaciens TaxID=1894 RepID=UPI001C473506|nr:hypothetical protein [Kitasatospora aureofaciens]MBV6701260.1 hypothetical protein [Kitasatospora aureofaciens]
MNSPKPPQTLHAPEVEVIERLQVVIYLSKTTSAFPELEMRSCEEYALTFGWDVSLTVVDDDMETPPDRRPKLQVALQRLKDKQAGAILVPSRATISPIDGEYDEFARQVEKAGGFLQVAPR